MKRFKTYALSCVLVSIFLLSVPLKSWSQSADGIAELEEQLQQKPRDETILFTLGQYYYYQIVAQAGDMDTMMEKGEKYLERLMELQPRNAKALAYQGSLYAIKGGRAKLPWDKLRHVNNGLEKMDQAVALAPGDVEVRVIRATTCSNLPKFFKRLDTAIEDFDLLIDEIEKHPDSFKPEFKARVYLNAGRAYQRNDNLPLAHQMWQKSLKSAPESMYAKEAQEMLKLTSE